MRPVALAVLMLAALVPALPARGAPPVRESGHRRPARRRCRPRRCWRATRSHSTRSNCRRRSRSSTPSSRRGRTSSCSGTGSTAAATSSATKRWQWTATAPVRDHLASSTGAAIATRSPASRRAKPITISGSSRRRAAASTSTTSSARRRSRPPPTPSSGCGSTACTFSRSRSIFRPRRTACKRTVRSATQRPSSTGSRSRLWRSRRSAASQRARRSRGRTPISRVAAALDVHRAAAVRHPDRRTAVTLTVWSG